MLGISQITHLDLHNVRTAININQVQFLRNSATSARLESVDATNQTSTPQSDALFTSKTKSGALNISSGNFVNPRSEYQNYKSRYNMNISHTNNSLYLRNNDLTKILDWQEEIIQKSNHTASLYLVNSEAKDISDSTNFVSCDSISQRKISWFTYSIYPNLGEDEYFIEFENMTPSLQIEIFNTNGKRIKNIWNASKRTKISISDYPSGVYVVKVSDEKQSSSKRIVIER